MSGARLSGRRLRVLLVARRNDESIHNWKSLKSTIISVVYQTLIALLQNCMFELGNPAPWKGVPFYFSNGQE